MTARKKSRRANAAPRGTSNAGGLEAEAKARLDRLIRKTRDVFYKPIAIAEILYRNRTEELDLTLLNEYRRASDRWSKDIARRLWGSATSSNSRYWDQMFDEPLMTPAVITALGRINCGGRPAGLVESYIYAHLHDKLKGLRAIIDWVADQNPQTFELETLISKFVTDERYVQSVDKLYEVVVYALFEVVTRRLDARISLTINPKSIVLKTSDDFALMVLGVNSDRPIIEQPAKLYRVGKANASDGGLDMWANFGPAVQVKHVSLTVDACEGICEKIYADKIIIVCKDVDTDVISVVLSQVGLGERVRGIIPESLLCGWYRKACKLGSDRTLGSDLLELLVREMSHEFSTSQDEVIDRMMRFSAERQYRYDRLPGAWQNLWVDS